MTDNKRTEIYDCSTPGCTNNVYFGARDEAFYMKQGYIDANGVVMRPKRCKACRLERKTTSGKTQPTIAKSDYSDLKE